MLLVAEANTRVLVLGPLRWASRHKHTTCRTLIRPSIASTRLHKAKHFFCLLSSLSPGSKRTKRKCLFSLFYIFCVKRQRDRAKVLLARNPSGVSGLVPGFASQIDSSQTSSQYCQVSAALSPGWEDQSTFIHWPSGLTQLPPNGLLFSTPTVCRGLRADSQADSIFFFRKQGAQRATINSKTLNLISKYIHPSSFSFSQPCSSLFHHRLLSFSHPFTHILMNYAHALCIMYQPPKVHTYLRLTTSRLETGNEVAGGTSEIRPREERVRERERGKEKKD